MLINQSECRKLLLSLAEKRWPDKFTGVQKKVYQYLEACLRTEAMRFVNQHPTKGKRLMISANKRKKETNELV